MRGLAARVRNLTASRSGRNGNVYANTYASGRLFRVEMGQGGKAGRITQLKTTPGFEHPDGMRAYGKNGLLVVEGANAVASVSLSSAATKPRSPASASCPRSRQLKVRSGN